MKVKSLIYKSIKKAHLSNPLLNIISLIPSKVTMTEEEALSYIKDKYYHKASCVHHNTLKPQYDLQIIVPCYNVESYVGECIKSVLNQKTKYKVLLVLINDGSKDNTLQILKNFQEYDNVMIIDQENRGFSGARNRGLETLYGKYLMFLDSDDLLTDGSIDALMDKAYEGYDIVQGGHISFNENKEIKSNNHKLSGYPWGKVFKSELFSNLCFPEKYWFEDSIVALIIKDLGKKVGIIDDYVYKYRDNLGGISRNYTGKIKCLDSLYITLSLMEDRKNLGLENTEDFEITLLNQLCINQKRIQTINDKKLWKASYVISRSLYNKEYKAPSSKSHNNIRKAFVKDNYRLFKYTASLL